MPPDSGPALQEPVGGAADAGGDAGADPRHHRLRAAGAAAGLAAGRRRSQPDDAGRRSGAPGLRRRRSAGRRPGPGSSRSAACWRSSARSRCAGCAASRFERSAAKRRRQRRARPARQLAGGRARRRPLRLHPAQPRPLPVAVVLGLLLRGDRLAPLRPGPLARRAGDPARRPARGRLRRPHDLLGPAGLAEPAALLQRRLAQRLPDRDDPAAAARLGLADRRRRPGRGAADRRPGGLAAAATATSRATACSGSCSRTSRGSTPRPSSTRSGAGAPNGRIGFPCLVRRNRRLGFDARRVRDRGGPVLCEDAGQHAVVALAAGAGRPSATPALVERLWDERRGLFLDEAQPGGARPGVLTWAALAPLALPDLPEEIGRRLVEEHLLREERVPDPGRTALGRRLGAELRAGRQPRPDPPLLARPDLGQHRLAGLARMRRLGYEARRRGWPTA